MSINAQGYFNALRSYLNTSHYGITETDAGKIVLKEEIYPPGSTNPVMQKVRLIVTGEALVINLDKKISKKITSHSHCSIFLMTTPNRGRSAAIL